jgi:branched-chain amino acid transport system substrate-binding protein
MKSFVLLAALLAPLFFLHPASVKAEAPIKIGIVDSYSGPATTFTYDVRDAFKLVIDEVNAKGGVVGRKIEFTTRDDKFKVDLALSMAKELVMMEKVDLLMGTINSAGSLAVSENREDTLPRHIFQD